MLVCVVMSGLSPPWSICVEAVLGLHVVLKLCLELHYVVCNRFLCRLLLAACNAFFVQFKACNAFFVQFKACNAFFVQFEACNAFFVQSEACNAFFMQSEACMASKSEALM